jgi:hypothetical protein
MSRWSDRVDRFDEGEWAPKWLRRLGRAASKPGPAAAAAQPQDQVGCVAGALGELAAFALLGLVVLLAVGLVEGVRRVSDDVPAVGISAVAVALALAAYGLLWTIRLKPGLYLENMRGAEEAVTVRQVRIGSGWVRGLRLTAMAFVQFAGVASFGFVIFWLMFD